MEIMNRNKTIESLETLTQANERNREELKYCQSDERIVELKRNIKNYEIAIKVLNKRLEMLEKGN